MNTPNSKPGGDNTLLQNQIAGIIFYFGQAVVLHGIDYKNKMPADPTPRIMALFTSKLNQATEEAETSTGLLREVMEPFDEDCRYDHHGYCQAHFLHDNPCPFGRAKLYLAQLTANQGNKEGE